MFKRVSGNRNEDRAHIEKLKASMSENYLFTVILTNENLEIIDGQHRFQAIKELSLPLNYTVLPGYKLSHVQSYNQNLKTWNAQDYLTSQCNLGNEEYIRYKMFKDKYGFGHNECIAMLTGTLKAGGHAFDSFKRGTFKITNMRGAEDVAKKIWMLKDVYDGFRRRSFVYAMMRLIGKPEFDFNEFLQKVRNNPSAIVNCNDEKQYTLLIEEIYNYRRRDKVNLRF